MAVNNPDRIAIIEMHIDLQFPLALPEARARWFTYPAPYPSGQNWIYVTPWIWYDGNPHCYDTQPFAFLAWDSLLADRMNVPSPFTMTMWGDWNPGSGTGTINAQFRNDSTDALTGHVLFVITEDSINFVGPNGDAWHNQVARDYIPDTIGSLASIPAGDSLTVSQAFALDTSWNYEKIRFVAFIQDTFMQPDSVIEIWQGAMLDIAELGIAEYENTNIFTKNITPSPNPCVSGTRFSFTLPNAQSYTIDIYDITGRKIRAVSGVAAGSEQTTEWDLRNDKGLRVSSGVYLYHFRSNEVYATGKVVVR
jgi:hypothetical protein